MKLEKRSRFAGGLRGRVFLMLMLCVSASAQNLTIRTVAGGGPIALPDNVPATSVALGRTSGLAVDAKGNLYVSIGNNGNIFGVARVDPAGLLTRVAGNGSVGFSGDNGPAISAQLDNIRGLAVDSEGNLFIADGGNGRIRKVSAGIITTVAGGGSNSGDNVPARSALLARPGGLAFDLAGNLYITEVDGHRVRRLSDGVITTVAGNGTASFSGDNGPATAAGLNWPVGVAVDAAGDLYIADGGNWRIRKVSAGIITTVAGGGTNTMDNVSAASAELNAPQGVALDSAGNVYISLWLDNGVRKLSGAVISLVGFQDTYNGGGVAVDSSGSVYAANLTAGVVHKYSNGVRTTIAGGGMQRPTFGGDNGPATSAQLSGPRGVALDSAGNLYIANTENKRVRKVSGGVITTVAGGGTSDSDNIPATSARLGNILTIAVDAAGSLYIADIGSTDVAALRVRKVSNGIITTVAGGTILGFITPLAIVLDSAGNLYIADYIANDGAYIRKVSGGRLITVAGGGTDSRDNILATNARLAICWSIAFDSAGNLYIAEQYRVRKVSNGIITTITGNGTPGFAGDNGPATGGRLGRTLNLAVDSGDNLYISDGDNARIRKVSGGVIATVAGSGDRGFGGDGGPATGAMLYNPRSIAFDTSGNLYIADTSNDRVRVLTTAALAPNGGALNGAGLGGGSIAPDEVITFHGGSSNIVPAMASGDGSVTTLGGISVKVTDSRGTERQAGLYNVGPQQITMVVPSGTATGPARIVVSRAGAAAPPIPVQVELAAPGVFSADGYGRGPALATVTTQGPDGAPVTQPTYQCSGSPSVCTAMPVEFGPGDSPLSLQLLATGIRNRSNRASLEVRLDTERMQVLSDSPQPDAPGVDQITVALPRSLAGSGALDLTITADGKTSNAVKVEFGISTNTAVFVNTDTTTQGSWKGVYGANGYNVINDTFAYPAFVTVTPSGQQSFTWASSTADVRGLQKGASSTDRIAATWFTYAQLTIDLQFHDSAEHQVAVYCLDWDGFTRAQTITVLDGTTNAVLDTRTLTSFHNGAYLVWKFTGRVKLQVTNTGGRGDNAVVSGLFF